MASKPLYQRAGFNLSAPEILQHPSRGRCCLAPRAPSAPAPLPTLLRTPGRQTQPRSLHRLPGRRALSLDASRFYNLVAHAAEPTPQCRRERREGALLGCTPGPREPRSRRKGGRGPREGGTRKIATNQGRRAGCGLSPRCCKERGGGTQGGTDERVRE